MFFILLPSPPEINSIYAQTKKTRKKRPRKPRIQITEKDKKSGYNYVKKQLRTKSRFFKFKYIIQGNDTFAIILKRLAKSGIRINSKTPAVRLIKKVNTHIKNWELLPPGTTIWIFFEKKDAVFDRVAYHFKLYDVQMERRRIAFEKRFGYNVFYMASSGSYTQINEQEDVNFTQSQNSPISAGLLYHFPSSRYHIMYSTSFYFSYLTGIQSSTGETVTPPIEFGANFYSQFYLWKLMPYFGVDFETFSSFNTDKLLESFEIEFDKHTVLYLTAGITKTFKIGDYPFLTKLSLSPSISTSTSSSSNVENKNYSGFKSIWYLNVKLNEKFFLHSMVKYHSMSDRDTLSILRLGFGGGYVF